MQGTVCPRYHHAVELIGKRWTGAIVRALFGGATRFGELAASVPELSDRMLSERLKELEHEGIVRRSVHAETPVRIEYHLTAKGRALEPVVAALAAWAEAWIESRGLQDDAAASVPAARAAAGDARHGPEGC